MLWILLTCWGGRSCIWSQSIYIYYIWSDSQVRLRVGSWMMIQPGFHLLYIGWVNSPLLVGCGVDFSFFIFPFLFYIELLHKILQAYPASTVVGARPLNPTRRQNNWQKSPRRVRRYNLPDGVFPKIGHFQTSFPAVPVGLGSFLWLHTTKQDT